MQKGYRRDGKGAAVIRFFIGLVVLVTALGLLYYFVVMQDYSDRIADPNYAYRSYVATDETPEPSLAPELEPEVTPESGPTATLPPYATPTPTPAGPTPKPTPSPTPEPTNVPLARLSTARKLESSKIPKLSDEIKAGLTRCYVSAIDGYKIMQVEGYVFADNPAFDGSNDDNSVLLIVVRDSTSEIVGYLAEKAEGVTGIEHEGAGKNLEGADFQAFIDVSKYADDVYSLGVALLYKDGEKEIYGSYKFDKAQTFAVRSGEVISPIKISQ